MNKESFENNINIPRNIEGEPNTEVLDALRKLSSRLEQLDSTVVGIAPFGSTMRGYSAEESDVDVVILIDDPEYVSRDEEPLIRQAIEIGDEITGNHPRISIMAVYNINSKKLKEQLSYDSVNAFAPLFLTATGDKINKYREHWADVFNSLPQERQEVLVNRTVDKLTHDYDLNSTKFRARASIKGLGPEELEEIAKARKSMWEERVKGILKID